MKKQMKKSKKQTTEPSHPKDAVTPCNFLCNLSRNALQDKLHETLQKRSHLATGSCEFAKKRKAA